jgi:hypothetical protein
VWIKVVGFVLQTVIPQLMYVFYSLLVLIMPLWDPPQTNSTACVNYQVINEKIRFSVSVATQVEHRLLEKGTSCETRSTKR